MSGVAHRSSYRLVLGVLVVVSILWQGCSSGSESEPQPGADALVEQLEALGLSAPATSQVTALLRDMRAAIGRSDAATAQARGFDVVGLVLNERGAGRVSARSSDVAEFLANVMETSGAGRPPLTDGSFGPDGIVAVVTTTGGDYVNQRRFAGLRVPPGAVSGQALLVAERLADSGRYAPQGGPLPTSVPQYPLFFDFSLTPSLTFTADAIIGICQVTEPESQFYIPDSIFPRIRLAHPSPLDPAQVEILERADTPFLECEGVTSGLAVSAIARRGGIGGRVRKFSPFGAVDPASGPLVIGTATLAGATIGTGYSATLTATGGDGVYGWSVATGSLPAGLSLSGLGVISGTPTALGTSTFGVQVVSAGQTVSRQFSIVVASSGASLEITTTTLPGGLVASPYRGELQAAGGSGTYVWSVAGGSLPPGLSLSGSGVISGTPTAQGMFSFTVRVTAGNATQQRTLSLVIAAPQDLRGPLNLHLEASPVDTIALLVRVQGPAIDSVQLLPGGVARSASATAAQVVALGVPRGALIARVWVRDTTAFASYDAQVLQAAKRDGYAVIGSTDVRMSLTR